MTPAFFPSQRKATMADLPPSRLRNVLHNPIGSDGGIARGVECRVVARNSVSGCERLQSTAHRKQKTQLEQAPVEPVISFSSGSAKHLEKRSSSTPWTLSRVCATTGPVTTKRTSSNSGRKSTSRTARPPWGLGGGG